MVVFTPMNPSTSCGLRAASRATKFGERCWPAMALARASSLAKAAVAGSTPPARAATAAMAVSNDDERIGCDSIGGLVAICSVRRANVADRRRRTQVPATTAGSTTIAGLTVTVMASKDPMSATYKRLIHWLTALAFCSAIESHAALPLQECRLQSEITSASIAARCAWLSVPEDREQATGKQVRLHVAVIPALRLEPAADPLFVLSGGPGQAASDFYIS